MRKANMEIKRKEKSVIAVIASMAQMAYVDERHLQDDGNNLFTYLFIKGTHPYFDTRLLKLKIKYTLILASFRGISYIS